MYSNDHQTPAFQKKQTKEMPDNTADTIDAVVELIAWCCSHIHPHGRGVRPHKNRTRTGRKRSEQNVLYGKRAAMLIGSSVVVKYAISLAASFVHNVWYSIATALVYEALVQVCAHIYVRFELLIGESDPQTRRRRVACAGFLVATTICTRYMTASAHERAGSHDPTKLQATITRCYDGDTCTADILGVHSVFGKDISIRIAGIDTPELRARCDWERGLAEEARDVVVSKLVGRSVTLGDPRRDKYFRILADIEMTDGGDMATHLLDLGLAIPYDGGKKTDWCAHAESAQRGVADRA